MLVSLVLERMLRCLALQIQASGLYPRTARADCEEIEARSLGQEGSFGTTLLLLA